MKKNAIDWFAIPTTNFERAVQFYESILEEKLAISSIDQMKFATFPYDRENGNVGGALVYMQQIQPSNMGAVVYLHGGDDLNQVLSRIETAGGKIIMQKTQMGDRHNGFIAQFIDTEGNRVGIHSEN
jgi:predicted enzyme related to lactoylglutathione lyase